MADAGAKVPGGSLGSMDRAAQGLASPGPTVPPPQRPKGVSSPASGGPRVCPVCRGRYPASFKVCPHDAQPLADATEEDAADPLLGEVLADSYEVVRVIGEGGMGRVYEARHTRIRSKRFAIKVLLEEYARHPDLVARFQREAEAAGSLSHPNVVGVYDVHRTADGRPYIVAELLEGEELGELLARVGKLEPARAVRMTRQLCRALEAAHARGIVHRDLKPENVFLVGDPFDPIVKVLDFGISKVADTQDSLTRTGMVIGTPAYMAPEQASGDKVDHRVDIYAVGAILYRAVTGKKPFDEKDSAATLTAVLSRDPRRPRQIASGIPEALELVIERAMSKSPAERYGSMEELEADLDPFDPLGALPAQSTVVGSEAERRDRHPDPSARTILANGTGEHQARTREARGARPMLVVWTLAGAIALAAALVATAYDALRWIGGPERLPTSTEAVLIGLGTALLSATPLFLWVRHLRARIWTSTARSVQLVRQLRRILAAAFATYGLGALALRLAEYFAWKDPGGAPPRMHISLFVVALAAGLVGWLQSLLERRRKN